MPEKEHPGTLKKSKLFRENPLQMQHSELLMFPVSTERIAPFFQYRMTDSTFLSSVDIGSVNLLRAHFHLMFTFFLYTHFHSPDPLSSTQVMKIVRLAFCSPYTSSIIKYCSLMYLKIYKIIRKSYGNTR